MKCLSFNLLTEMATFRSNRKIEKPGSVGSSGIFLLLIANCQFVATSVTWTAPPPEWTTSNSSEIRTVDMPVLLGRTQVALRWNYTLTSGSLVSTAFSIDDGGLDDIGTKSAGGNPIVFDRNDYRTRFDISRSEVATLIINKVTEREEAVYQCQVVTDSNSWRYRIRVIVTVPPSLTNVSRDQTVREESNMQLFCEAAGKPTPNVTWTRVLKDGSNSEILHQGPTWDFLNISRTASGTYNCTAYNGFGNPVSHQIKVNVTYPAKVVNVSTNKHDVEVQESVSLQCTAEGNPHPSYTWMPCDPQQSVCHESTLNVSEVLSDDVYTCTVTNFLGNDTGNVSVFIAGNVINVTLVITSESCTEGQYNQSSLWRKLNETIDQVFANESRYTGAQLRNVRCGSVTVDLGLKFNSTIREREVIDILRKAAKNGTLGEFKVNASSIIGTRPVGEKPTKAATTKPSSSSDSNTGVIVGAALGACAGVGVAVGAGFGARHVYKKRKCKKRDTKVHNNGSQEEAGGDVQGEGYVEVNRGYKGGTNRHSGGANPSQVPAVLYDTAQTGNRGAVKEPPVAQYAVVDKSKKKPKKPKPGELQYAELGEFSIGQGGPRSSTSPTSRHTETQYADVNAM